MTQPAKTGPRPIDPAMAEIEMREAGYEPLEPYPGTVVKAWRVRCVTCGVERRPRMNAIRNGMRCTHRSLTAERAVELVKQAGFIPQEPYPGTKGQMWRLQCADCGKPLRLTLTAFIRQERRCPCVQRAREAEADLRAAGYEPLEPYPGKTRIPWKARCLGCGQERTPNLDTVRQGKRCLHQTEESRRGLT